MNQFDSTNFFPAWQTRVIEEAYFCYRGNLKMLDLMDPHCKWCALHFPRFFLDPWNVD